MRPFILTKFIPAMLLALFSLSVHAEAGRVIFAYGKVIAQDVNGEVRTLEKRGYVEEGDIIRTGPRSMVQLRMIDKGFIAVRANSTLKIESYRLGANKDEDVGIFELLKGGLRAVTGIIGKRLRSAYRLRTVNATIGVRGTDYTVRLCNQDCNQAFGNLSAGAQIADGLYVGVNDGGISLTNQLGSLDLDELQYGYVKDATTAPVALLSAPEFLYFNSRPPDPDDEQASRGDDGETSVDTDSTVATRSVIEPASADLTSDITIQEDVQVEQVEVTQDQIEENIVIASEAESSGGSSIPLTSGSVASSRMIVTSYGKENQAGSIASAQSNPFSAANLSGNALQSFENDSIDFGPADYNRGTSSNIELGFDPETGIAWGRWNAGSAQIQSTTGIAATLDLNSHSLHWVAGPDQSQSIALPSSGTASYSLVGNTSPTDNLGNTGILGTATLDANFTSMTVDTSVAVGINNQVWNGAGAGLPIGQDAAFNGSLPTVNVVDTNGGTFTGSGSAAGFFTDNAAGAAMGFALEADINGTATSVSGTAIFQRD